MKKLLLVLVLSFTVCGVIVYLVTLLDDNKSSSSQTNPPLTAAAFGPIPIIIGVRYLLNKDKKDKERSKNSKVT